MFDVVLPALEDDEFVINSGLLKDYVTRMIDAGRRNLSIDLSPYDEIYSGDINVLVALNTRALEVGGQFVLLATQKKVIESLEKAGITGTVKVLGNEAELLALSDGIAAAAVAQAMPQSEFEDLRSEIGSMFGDDPVSTAGVMHTPAPTPAPVAPSPEIVQFTPPPPPPPSPMMATPATPPASIVTPDIQLMPPQSAPIDMVMPDLQPMAPPPASGIQLAPLPEMSKAPAFPPPQQQPVFGDATFSVPTSEIHAKPSFDDEFDDEFGGKKKKKAKPPIDDFDDEFDKPKAKKLPLAAIAAVFVLAAVGIVLYIVLAGGEGDDTPPAIATVTPTPPAPEMPDPTGAQPPAAEAPIAAVTETRTPPSPPPPPPPPSARGAAPSKQQKAATQPSTQKQARAAAPPPPPPPPPVAPPPPPPAPIQDQLTITSSPPNATVEIDGRRVGTTPHRFRPESLGDITVTVSLSGYESVTRDVDFMGGTMTIPFTLRAAAEPSAPPPPPPPPVAPPPPPPAAVALPPPPTQPPAVAPAGGATIFIATLPSHADIYIGGRLVGRSNDGEISVPTGTHQVRFVKDGQEKTESITFQPGRNPTRFVNLR